MFVAHIFNEKYLTFHVVYFWLKNTSFIINGIFQDTGPKTPKKPQEIIQNLYKFNKYFEIF